MKICWKKVSAAVVAFFGIGALTACYGMPPQETDAGFVTVFGKVSTVNNGDTQVINNVKVSVSVGNKLFSAITNQNGFYEINMPFSESRYDVVFEDQNGKFQNDTVNLLLHPGYATQEVDMVLKTK